METDQHTKAAEDLIRRYGSKAAALTYAEENRDRNSWGTFSFAFWNQLVKAIQAT